MEMKRDIESSSEWMRRKMCSRDVILAALDFGTRPTREGVQESSKITYRYSSPGNFEHLQTQCGVTGL